eukprot:TRINITY_DN113138_c0_g1_i1.p1 TRINITY_DN113138_c0_g1~~TRINITY_DN113138_c0_g1_i1.p1  ORF type:complete len:821 (-),score=117.13 TRINITY_DN113138_c0_g1_i1:224-2686(-)
MSSVRVFMTTPHAPDPGEDDECHGRDALLNFQALLQRLATMHVSAFEENRSLKQERQELLIRLAELNVRCSRLDRCSGIERRRHDGTDTTTDSPLHQSTVIGVSSGLDSGCNTLHAYHGVDNNLKIDQANCLNGISGLPQKRLFMGPCAHVGLLKPGCKENMPATALPLKDDISEDVETTTCAEKRTGGDDHDHDEESQSVQLTSVGDTGGEGLRPVLLDVLVDQHDENQPDHANGVEAQPEYVIKFGLAAIWSKEVDKDMQMSVTRSDLHRSLSRLSKTSSSSEVDEPVSSTGESIKHDHAYEPAPSKCPLWMQRLVCSPTSPQRIGWDVFGAALVVYDVIFLPLQAFNDLESMWVLNFMALCYWTANIFASMTVGFTKNGVVVMQPELVFLKYLKAWLIIDLVIVIPDWIDIASQGETEPTRSSPRILHVLRYLRLAKLVRLLRLKRVVDKGLDMVDSEATTVILKIVKMLALLIMITHFIACCMYAIGNNDKANSWVKEYGVNTWPWGEAYGIAFHWTLTQFTPSSKPPIQPQNLNERLAAILVVMFALVGFSYVVGSITQSLAQLRNLHEAKTGQLWNLRRYLRHNKVSLRLRTRIHKYIDHQMNQMQDFSVMGGSSTLLSSLSTQLRGELQYEITVPHLAVHPLMARFSVSNMAVMRRIAFEALTRASVAEADVVFTPGEQASYFSVVVLGRLIYSRILGASTEREWVDPMEDWIAEPSLWCTKWNHLGELQAHMPAELLQIAPAKFSFIVSVNVASYMCALEYSQNYLQWLNAQPYHELSDITQGEKMTAILDGMLPGLPARKEIRPGRRSVIW